MRTLNLMPSRLFCIFHHQPQQQQRQIIIYVCAGSARGEELLIAAGKSINCTVLSVAVRGLA